MQIEVKTRSRMNADNPEVIMEIGILPRGSGNRNKACGIAAWYANHGQLKPHITKIVTGTSKVTVHFRPSLQLMKVMLAHQEEHQRTQDLEGQLKLFGLAEE